VSTDVPETNSQEASPDEPPAAVEAAPEQPDFRSGFVVLAGRPNAGKSTLLNHILGTHLAITSDKPQTTRNRIVGIHNTDTLQAVLIDTPGLHKARSRLNRALVDVATAALTEADVTCWVVDAVPLVRSMQKNPDRSPFNRGHTAVGEVLAGNSRGPVLVALNKVDRCNRGWLLPVIAAFSEQFPNMTIVPVSAKTGIGVDGLIDVWRNLLPAAPPMYPPDQWTEASERFLVAELVREQLFRLTKQEVPYSTAVEVEKFDEGEPQEDGSRGRVEIYCRILVERGGQKGIVIGKGGTMLREIGQNARRNISELLDARVRLELHVSVKERWSESPHMLHELGIR
jgi:GTP-binding protein Era